MRVGAVAAQLVLLTLVVRTFDIESSAFFRVMVIACGGFVVHHLAPARLRLPIFVVTSLTAMVSVLGPVNAAQVVGLGLVVIGIAHLPLRVGIRIALLFVTGGVFAALRSGTIHTPLSSVIWPIFGAMFMFRLIIYMYDLKNRAAPFGFWRATAYFFMLPNVCFPLFPVVDYKSFCRTYYDEEDIRIYQTGVEWILRGIVQLLIYRWAYQNLLVGPESVATALDAALFLVTAYLMYLKISGSFHMIVGILHVFGFNLGATNNKYFLSEGFTDYWRRINIYWKDFLQKIVFNPVYFRLSKKVSGTAALVLATAIAFFATWALHSYQWFWIRGSFPVVWQDIAFWSLMGLLVLGNMLYENKYGRQRSLKKTKHSLASETKLALRTMGTFVVICWTWVIWSSESLGEVGMVLSKLVRPDARDLLVIMGGLAALGVVAVWVARSERGRVSSVLARAKQRGPAPIWGRSYQVAASCTAMLVVAYAPLLIDVNPAISNSIDNLKTSRLNARDAQMMDRGYYEDLTNVVRFNTGLGDLYNEKPPNWDRCWAMHPVEGFPDYELMPNKHVWFKGTMMTTNQWGMRDRACEKTTPPETYRIAILGGSHPMGTGVEDDQVFDNLAEDALTREHANEAYSRYEFLNFSVGGFGPMQVLADMDRRVLDFQFDALMVTSIDDLYWVTKDVIDIAQNDFPVPYAHVKDLMREAGLTKETSYAEGFAKMKPHSEALLLWTYQQFVQRCKDKGIVPILAVLPHTSNISKETELVTRKARQAEVAREAGMVVLDLTHAYDSVEPRTLWIAPWDSHPNAEGHRLLADALCRALRTELTL
jgi:D-alanyl-lipoteichoic acid acyltransferase DltB (MBOAT superfamily)